MGPSRDTLSLLMPPSTMRAVVSKSGGSLAVESVPIPEPGRGEVRVRVSACGICGSDLHLFHSGLMTPGLTPGHEIAGIVDALGPGVNRVAKGDHVAVIRIAIPSPKDLETEQLELLRQLAELEGHEVKADRKVLDRVKSFFD